MSIAMPSDAVAHSAALMLTPYRLTVRQFATMSDAGVFRDEARIELLGGLLVEMMTTNDPHEAAIAALGDIFRRLVPAGWIVREEKSLQLGRYWRPLPDLILLRGSQTDYFRKAPRAVDLAMIVEISNSTYAKDRRVKWPQYAASRIATYWIVNLPRDQVEVYTNPRGRGTAARYADCVVHGKEAEVPLFVEGVEVGRVAVRDFLP